MVRLGIRPVSTIAIGCLSLTGGPVYAQAVVLEARASQLGYGVGEPIFIDVIASWDPDDVGAVPGVPTALAGFNFRVDTQFGLRPVAVVFEPDLEPNAVVDTWNETGVEISGFQAPPFLVPPNESNPIVIATVECEAVFAPVLNEVSLQFTAPTSISIYTDVFGVLPFGADIGDPSVETISSEVFVGGGPCCDDPCNPSDLAEPYGTLNFSDVTAFLEAFTIGDIIADVAEPPFVLDFSDVVEFLIYFADGCP